MSIPIYTAERELGLAEVIAQSCVLAYHTPVISADQEILREWARFSPKDLEQTFASNNNFDLYPVYDILVTVGWNKNDDIFDKEEVYNARSTPEDKPFNLEHIPSKIVGHITGNCIIDDQLKIFPDDTPLTALPSKFHILTSSVIYKHLNSREPELTEASATLIQEIKDGLWCVSMEALFSDFDYGMTNTSGDQKIVTRCEGTSFLTKYLRSYGGSGVYNNCKIGRVLKNITFSGKGLVKNPANPESIIINDIQQFAGVVANVDTIIDEVKINMDEKLLEQIKTLEAQLAEANKKIEEFDAQQTQAKLEAKDAEIAKLNDGVQAANTQIAELTKKVEDASAIQKTLDDTLAQLAEANQKLAEIAAQAKVATRIAALTEAGVENEEVDSLVTKFADLNDEVFASIVEVLAKKKKAGCADDSATTAKKCKKCGKDGCDESCADVSVDPAGAAAAEVVNVDNVVVDPDPALAVASNDGGKELIAGIAEFLGQQLKNGK